MAGTVICDYINSANVSGGFLGIGQTWQDVTANRSSGTTYTNSTGKPIAISIFANSTTTDSRIELYVNNTMISWVRYPISGNTYGTSFAIIPPLGTYSVIFVNATLNAWLELR